MALELLADIMILLEKDLKLRFKTKGKSLSNITLQHHKFVFWRSFNIIKDFYFLPNKNYILFFVLKQISY